MLHTARAGTPCLLVRGSGKAADMISDAVLVRYAENHPAYVKHRSALQRQFWEFVQLCGIDASSSDDSGIHDWEVAITRIKQEIMFLETTRDRTELKGVALQMASDNAPREHEAQKSILDHSRILREKAKALVTEGQDAGYAIVGLGKHGVEEENDILLRCFTILKQALEAGERW